MSGLKNYYFLPFMKSNKIFSLEIFLKLVGALKKSLFLEFD